MILYIFDGSPAASAPQARGLTGPSPSARCAKGRGHKGLSQIGDGAVAVTQPRIAYCFAARAFAPADTAQTKPVKRF